MARTQRYAEAQRPRALRWGIPGLLLFVWFPFWMTGPVVGSIIGFLIGLGPWTTMAVVLAGTGLAIVCWVFVLDQVFVQLRALGPYVPFVFGAVCVRGADPAHRDLHSHPPVLRTARERDAAATAGPGLMGPPPRA